MRFTKEQVNRCAQFFIISLGILIQVGIGQLVPNKIFAEEEQTEEENQDEIDALEEKIKKYEKKIKDIREKKGTLKSEIDFLDNQMELTQLKITTVNRKLYATIKKIENLKDEIENLNNRLDKIAKSIEYQEKLLGERQREQYKTGQSVSKGLEILLFLIKPLELDKQITKTTYSQVMQEKDKNLLDEMNRTREAYKNQKGIFESKKAEEEKLKAQVASQKAELVKFKAQLDSQKAEKKNLLESTQNDELKYQELLKEAQAELDSFRGFVSNAGGSVIGANEFGKGKKGWYFSQRDARWANVRIGKSRERIFDVGCLVTSVAMVYKAEGYNMSPEDIAHDSSRFWYNTAMMLRPWRGPGTFTTFSVRNIDSLLKKHPVIVGVRAGLYGTHFVVLAEKDDDDYVLYDPWYGPDLDFSDYYRKSQIFSVVAFL